MNVSLRSGEVPDCLKSAVLVPGLKKPSLETNDFSSFRPISNLKFVAKAIEKVVAVQTCQHILDNNLDELYQSAYNDAWMACNKLELNGGKTELLVLNALSSPSHLHWKASWFVVMLSVGNLRSVTLAS